MLPEWRAFCGDCLYGSNSNPAPPSSCLSPPGTPKCAYPGSDTNKCPASGTLGIKYGHCYTITDLHAKPVTRPNAPRADKGNIRSFTAQIKCFFGKCSPCLSLVPKSGATPSFVGLGLSFIASYGDAVLLDGLKNSCLSVIFQETACPT